MNKVKVGVVGCGTISGIYLQNLPRFDAVEVVACADVVPDRARDRAEKYGVPRACSVDELLDDPSIDLVLNLTTPDAHAPVAMEALRARKSVYNEKPLALARADARELMTLAETHGVRVGCAPDTFLGGGIQTCRRVLDSGVIGDPVAATAFFLSHGPEGWHPNPDFYYQPGAGPMFDMGPYYLTALAALIGPVRRVSGAARVTFPERVIGSEPLRGAKITVRTPTHVAGTMEFENGAIGTIATSFDVWSHHLPRIEIYGTLGSLSVPDPNTFAGPVWLRMAGEAEWQDVPVVHGYTENSRGLGVADMAHALRTGRAHRANQQLAYHVLDLMHAFHETAATGSRQEIASRCDRPAPMCAGLPVGILDD